MERWSDTVDGTIKSNAEKIKGLEKEIKELKARPVITKFPQSQVNKDEASNAVFEELEERKLKKILLYQNNFD